MRFLLISSKGTKGSYNDGIWTIGTLTNHESISLVLTTKVTKSGDIENVVVATTTTYDPNITNNRDKEVTTPEVGEADLEIIKVADKSMFKVGDNIVWTITVTNYGPNNAINVVVEDWFIGDVKYISSSVSKGKYNPKGIWTIGELDVGETVVLKLVTKVLSGNYVLNNAVVVSSTPDPDLDNNRDDELVTIDEDDDGNRNTPEPQKGDSPNPTPKTSTPKMHAAGNPIVMVLLALLAIAGVSLRRKI